MKQLSPNFRARFGGRGVGSRDVLAELRDSGCGQLRADARLLVGRPLSSFAAVDRRPYSALCAKDPRVDSPRAETPALARRYFE